MTPEDAYQAVERHLRVTRTARYWTVGDPGPGDEGEVWFVLHGYKQLARRFLRRFEAIATSERLIVAPEGLSRFYVSPEPGRHDRRSVVGATWMTREDRLNEIEDYVRYLDRLAEEVGAAGHRITVLGFSQGVATATRWVVRGTVRPERLILWGDVTPPDLDLERAGPALAEVAVSLVRGNRDPAFEAGLVAAEAERLAAGRVDYDVIAYDGGHDIDADTLRRIAGS